MIQFTYQQNLGTKKLIKKLRMYKRNLIAFVLLVLVFLMSYLKKTENKSLPITTISASHSE